MADGSDEAFGAAHVPCVGICEDFGDACDGFAVSGDRHDGSDLWKLSETSDLVDPEQIVPHKVGGFLDRPLI